MFTHCNRKFKSEEVWFLKDNKNFRKRKFYLATCPICKKGLAKLADKSLPNFKNSLFGFCYGENHEIHNSKGEVVEIRQKSCDFFGNKELIFSLKIKTPTP